MLVTWTRACSSCVTRPASKATVSGERSAFDQPFALPQVDRRASMRYTCRCAKSPQVSMPRPRLTASRPPGEKTFWRRRPRGHKSPHLETCARTFQKNSCLSRIFLSFKKFSVFQEIFCLSRFGLCYIVAEGKSCSWLQFLQLCNFPVAGSSFCSCATFL